MKTRYRVECFLPYDEERIIRHLEKMAEKVLVGEFVYHLWNVRSIGCCRM